MGQRVRGRGDGELSAGPRAEAGRRRHGLKTMGAGRRPSARDRDGRRQRGGLRALQAWTAVRSAEAEPASRAKAGGEVENEAGPRAVPRRPLSGCVLARQADTGSSALS